MPNNLIHCPNPLCNDEGWYPDYDRNGEAEQVQCEFCYTNSNSYFNALQQSVQPTPESGRDSPVESIDSEGSAPANSG